MITCTSTRSYRYMEYEHVLTLEIHMCVQVNKNFRFVNGWRELFCCLDLLKSSLTILFVRFFELDKFSKYFRCYCKLLFFCIAHFEHEYQVK